MARAVVFDFDGVILDTETPLYLAWQATFRHFGCEPISRAEWIGQLGRGDGDPLGIDPWVRLAEAAGRDLPRADVETFRRPHRDRLIAAEAVRPGIGEWLEAARARRIPVAVASSSSSDWVEGHLRTHGLLEEFTTISCAGGEVPAKPDPATYLRACVHLGVEPSDAIAIEDSHNGVAAARRAGLFTIAVPGPLLVAENLTVADVVGASLADLDPAVYLDRIKPPR